MTMLLTKTKCFNYFVVVTFPPYSYTESKIYIITILDLINELLVIGFKLVAAAIASNAFTGVAIGVGFIFASLVYSISRNPSQRDELLRFSFIGFSLVEASGLIGLVMSFLLLFGL